MTPKSPKQHLKDFKCLPLREGNWGFKGVSQEANFHNKPTKLLIFKKYTYTFIRKINF